MMRFMLMTSAVLIFMASARACDEMTADEKRLIELVNAERQKADLPPFKANAKLMKAARSHSAHMARKKELAHELDGNGPGERLEDVAYVHRGWGENCAAGQRTPAEAIRCWMNSEGHRANIHGNFQEIGVGLAKSPDGTVYWTQVFALPGR